MGGGVQVREDDLGGSEEEGREVQARGDDL